MKTDLAIVGAGPGGYVAALRAAQLGMRVVVVESTHLGGTCLNRGCIPTKAMLETATVAHMMKRAATYGVVLETLPRIDLAVALARRDAIVKQLRTGVRGLLAHNNVTVMAGRARFLGANSLAIEPTGCDVGLGKNAKSMFDATIEAANIIIATGSKAAALPMPGSQLPGVIDSDGALALTSVPKSIAIIGAGAIGCEWSCILSRLGCQVTLIEKLPQVLPQVEKELGAVLAEMLISEGITVHTGATIRGILQEGSNLRVQLEYAAKDGEEGMSTQAALEVEHVLVAAGRLPVVEDLDLRAAGVETGPGGWIPTDSYQRTNVASVLAIGDVTGGPLLAHVASREGIVAVEKLAELTPRPLSVDRVPFVVYTDPEIACVGLTEEQALGRGYQVAIGRFSFANNGRAVAQGKGRGLVKVVAEARFGQLLGVHMVGPNVSELVAEAVLAIETEASLGEFTSVVRAHPTLSEAIMEAGLAAAGRALHSVGGWSR